MRNGIARQQSEKCILCAPNPAQRPHQERTENHSQWIRRSNPLCTNPRTPLQQLHAPAQPMTSSHFFPPPFFPPFFVLPSSLSRLHLHGSPCQGFKSRATHEHQSNTLTSRPSASKSGSRNSALAPLMRRNVEVARNKDQFMCQRTL